PRRPPAPRGRGPGGRPCRRPPDRALSALRLVADDGASLPALERRASVAHRAAPTSSRRATPGGDYPQADLARPGRALGPVRALCRRADPLRARPRIAT